MRSKSQGLHGGYLHRSRSRGGISRGDRRIVKTTSKNEVIWVETIRMLAETFVLIAAVGFLISIVANSIIFNAWELDFLQIATPNDIIISGLSIFGEPIAFLMVGVLAYIAGKIFAKGRIVDSIFIATLVVALSNQFLVMRYGYLGYLGTFAAATGCASRIGIYIDKGKSYYRPYRIMLTLLFSVMLLQGLAVGWSNAKTITSAGYMWFGNTIITPGPASNCEVLWIGERAVVASCARNKGPIVILNAENLMVQVRRIRS